MDERTALHIAANIGAADVVSCLLMAKPNLDKVSRGATTDSKQWSNYVNLMLYVHFLQTTFLYIPLHT